jgi:hypothetical protein
MFSGHVGPTGSFCGPVVLRRVAETGWRKEPRLAGRWLDREEVDHDEEMGDLLYGSGDEYFSA